MSIAANVVSTPSQQSVKNDPFLNQVWQAYSPTIWDKGAGYNSGDWQSFTNRATALKDQFSNSFQSLVGRAPTNDELGKFVTDYVGPNAWDVFAGDRAKDPYTYINQYVSQNDQQAAKDYATQQLTAQQTQANGLADMFRKQGNDAINQTEQSLLDYQSKLFEKLRPSLLTSLQSQGLLDTGGMNEAVAGAQADLANSVQPFLANARLSNENQANAIAYGGASAPYQYQQGLITQQLPYLQSQGQTAQNQAYNSFLTNTNFGNQMALLNRQGQIQSDLQPSMLTTMGQSFAHSFGSQAGTSAAQMPFAAFQSMGGSSLGPLAGMV